MLFRLLLAAAFAGFASAAVAAPPEYRDVDRLIDRAVGLPSLPTAPPADLTAPEPAAAPAAPPLAIEVTSARPAPDKAMVPGAPRPLRIAVANRGTAPQARVKVVVRVEGARIEPGPGWRLDGTVALAEIATLAPGARTTLALTVRSAEVPAGVAAAGRALVDARAEGQPPAATEFAWTIRDCPGAYRAALLEVRAGALAEMRAALAEMRKGDPALPQGLRFLPPREAIRGAAGDPARLAAAIAGRRGGDPELSRSPLDYTAERIILELDHYMNQRAVPTLCTGASVVVNAYRKAFTPVENRLALIRTQAAKARVAEGDAAGDLAARARRAAVDAGLVAADAPEAASPLATLAAARAALSPDSRPDPAAAAALSAIEVEAWLTVAEAGASRVSRAFAATLDGILAAHDASCTCAP
ncbi:hypothetical protein [Blastochloris viridis]|uniref:TolA protein n=1 Tax=Blastochloris viridis TaxID=1079 RepID=A0A0H5BA25_BLAVI|nr:hypothetical protein [Blastochloris viridis]ALK10914.1 hypothetical protein BVIR_3156 [Blastochloris viridis]BAR99107.1 TolA protein [Blastochloris viridis]CUU43576.1 hypothetical protein BVIRIDIS_26000 [Blastochloris viridis]